MTHFVLKQAMEEGVCRLSVFDPKAIHNRDMQINVPRQCPLSKRSFVGLGPESKGQSHNMLKKLKQIKKGYHRGCGFLNGE